MKAWTKAFRKARGKEMATDAAFDFEKKRNRIAKYDREVMAQTVYAMRKVAEIRAKREERFWELRRKEVAPQIKANVESTIAKNIDVLKRPINEIHKTNVVTSVPDMIERAKQRAARKKAEAAAGEQ